MNIIRGKYMGKTLLANWLVVDIQTKGNKALLWKLPYKLVSGSFYISYEPFLYTSSENAVSMCRQLCYGTWQKKVNVIKTCNGYGFGWPMVTEMGVLEFTYGHNYEHNMDRALR